MFKYMELRILTEVGLPKTICIRGFTVFAAYVAYVPVDVAQEHVQRALLKEYKDKFNTLPSTI